MNQRGSATIALAGSACALVILGGVALGVGSGVILRQQIGHAVDEAALAASDVSRGVISGEPCVVAREILVRARASLVFCDELEGSVVVRGRVTKGIHSVLATARAGVSDGGEK